MGFTLVPIACGVPVDNPAKLLAIAVDNTVDNTERVGENESGRAR
jgi:hypothetical protein